MTSHPRVGVLAIQGDFEAHARALRRVGAEPVLVRRAKELDGLAALILPGGESTTISKGMQRLGLYEPLRSFAESGRPVLGTCAGAILLAARVENHGVASLGLVDVTAVRNAYGTQVDSFVAPVDAGAAPGLAGLRCVFIRAPQLRELGPGRRGAGARGRRARAGPPGQSLRGHLPPRADRRPARPRAAPRGKLTLQARPQVDVRMVFELR